MPEEPDIQQALLDFDATIKAKPNLTDEELFQKFPEFGNDVAKLQSAKDYSATLNSGKYKGVEEFNSKFPEFFAVEKKSEVGVVDGSKSQSSGSVTDLYKQGTTETAVTELAGKQEPVEPVRQNKEALLYEKKYGDMPELVQQKNIEIAEKTKWKPTLSEQENFQLNEARKDLAEKEKYLASYQSPVNVQDRIDPLKFQKETDVANAKIALEKMETVAKFRDTDNYIPYYNTETFEPIAVPKVELGQFFQDFMDEEFGNRRDIVNRGIDANEFKDKKFNELDESAQRVVLNAFAAKYLPKDDLQSYLSSQNLSFDLGKAPHAGNQFVKGALGTTAAILDGAEGNIAEADVLNANYVKAQSGMITKSEYERKYSELAIDITSKIKNGQYVTTNKLPGIQPLETKMQGGFGNPEATPTYIYSEDQIQKWLSKAPTYEETMNGAESPYLYENGLLGNWAEGIKKVADSRMSNPAYKENLLLTDIPQATGSSVPFIVSTILSRGTNIPANILTAVTGGLANSSGVYEDAINSGATASEAKKAYYLAFGIGTTEAIPLDRLMDRFAVGTGLGKKAIEVLLQGGEEAIQEGATSLNNSLLARFVYDESQKIGETLKSDAGLGLATGMIMAAGKLVSTSKTATPEQKDLAKKGIEQLQNYLKQRGNVAKEQAKINVEKPVVETKVEPEVVVEEEKIVEPGSGTGGKEPTLEEQMQMELDANPDKRDEILAKYEKKDVKNVEVDKKADIERRRIETEAKIKRKDLFSAGGIFSNELGGSGVNSVPTNHREVNGIEFVEFSNPNTGVVDVIMTGVSDSDFVGYYRLYENGKPTNKWSSKFENQSRNKDNFKTMISGVQEMLPQGHEYTEKTSISTDGLRVWNQQLSKGYELQYDNNGNLITNTVIINGDAIVNELGIDVNKGNFDNISVTSKGQFESVKKALLPYLQKFGLNESNIRNVNGTVEIDLPILKNNKIQQGESRATSNQSEIETQKADIERRRQEELKQPIKDKLQEIEKAVKTLNITTDKDGKLEQTSDEIITNIKSELDKIGLPYKGVASNENGSSYKVITNDGTEIEVVKLLKSGGALIKPTLSTAKFINHLIKTEPQTLRDLISNQINAKYDAELKALENKPTPSLPSNVSSEEEGSGVGGDVVGKTFRDNYNRTFEVKGENAGILTLEDVDTGKVLRKKKSEVLSDFKEITEPDVVDKTKTITEHLPKGGELKGVTEIDVSENGEEVSYGTKTRKTSITVKGLSAEEIKQEIKFEKQVLERSKRDAANFNEDEIRSAKGMTRQEKEDAIKMHKQSLINNEQVEKIVIPFYEKHLEIAEQSLKETTKAGSVGVEAKKYTLNAKGENSAPNIPISAIDQKSSGLEDIEDVKQVKLLEIRGKNSQGQTVGTVWVQKNDGQSYSAEVFFNDAELADLEQQPIQEISEPDTKQAELDAKIEEGKKRLAEAKAKLTAKEEVKVEEPKVETVAVEPVKEEPKDETNTEIPSLSEIKSDVIERNGTKSYIVEKPNVIKGDDTSKMWYKYEGDNGEELYHSELGFDYNMKGEKLPKGSADKLLTDNKKIFEDRNKINEAPKPLLDAILNDEKGWLSRMNESSTLQELEEIEKELQTNGELKKQLLGKEGKDFYSRLNYLRRKEGGAPEQNPISERLSKYGWTVEPQGKDQVVRNANGKIVATVKTKGAKYEIIGNDGAKLMSGNKNVAEAVEKVATKYFMAQEKVAKVETPVEEVKVEAPKSEKKEPKLQNIKPPFKYKAKWKFEGKDDKGYYHFTNTKTGKTHKTKTGAALNNRFQHLPKLPEAFEASDARSAALQYFVEGGTVRTEDLEIARQRGSGKLQKEELTSYLWALDNTSLPLDIIADGIAERNGLDGREVEKEMRDLLSMGKQQIAEEIKDLHNKADNAGMPSWMVRENKEMEAALEQEAKALTDFADAYSELSEEEIAEIYAEAAQAESDMEDAEIEQYLETNKTKEDETIKKSTGENGDNAPISEEEISGKGGEETDIDKRIASKKAELKARKANRGNLGIGENLGEKNAEMLAAYTDLAILYAQKGIKTAIEFAKELGEDINEFIQEAWDKANSEPVEEIVEEPKPEPKTPEETEEEEPEERKKALLNRAFKGATEEELKAAIEKHGLTYEVESWEAAKKKARALIDDIGIEAAVQAVKDRVVVGAPAAFVWGEAIDSIHNAITTAETTEESERLTKLEADLMSEFDKQAREQGRFISALLDVYANSDFQYDLETQIQKYKDNNSGIIPKEVEDKMRELSEQLKDIQAKYEEAKKRNDELEYAENVRNIQDSVNREKGTPMSQSEIDAAIEKGVESELNKAMARLSDTRKKTAKKAIERLDKMYDSLSGMNFDATIGIPVAIVRGGIKTIIAGIKLTGKVADAIESGMKHIQEEYEKQFGKKLPISEYGRVKTFIKDNLKDAGLEVSNRKDKPIKEKDGKIVIPPALIRELVESGLTDPNELTQAVLQEVQKSLPEATERQVRDAISNYGRTVNQSQEDIDIEIRKIKRAQRIISALEDIANKKRPLRSGLQRDKLDAEERALQKQLKEALKSLPPDTALEAKQLKTTLDVIEKRLLNQIEDLQREIDAEERTVKERKEIPYTDRIKELIAERDAKKAEHEEIFGKPELTAEQRLEIAIKAINRAAAKVEERIRKGELTTTPNVSLTSAEKEAAKKRLADARAQLMEMQELAGIPEQKRLEQAKNNAKRRIAELQNKIDIGDFAKKKQKKIIKDDELRTLIAEKNRIQEKFNKLQYEAELRNRSKTQKVIDALLEVWGITRALRATAEFSFMLIQGGFYAVSHPLTAIKAFALAVNHLLSTSKSERFAEFVKTQDWYEGAREDKLAITEVDYKLSAREELFLNGWVNHIWDVIGLPLKLVSEKAFQRWKLASFPKAFERSNVGAMNLIRITRYLKGVEMLEAQGKTRETHPQDYKNVADMVNTFTGRASLGGLENNKATSKLLTTIFFSPKMWASTLKTFTPYAFIHFGKMGSAEIGNTGNFGKDKKVGKRQVSVAQKMAMADYMKYVGLTTAAVMAIALRYNNDDDEDTSVELDPRSSDFLKIKIGNTRVDPWGGRIQMIVLQARLLAESMNRMTREEGWAAKLGWRDIPSYKRTSSGELVRLGEGYTDTMGGLLTTMTKNKLAPSAALVNKWLFAKLDKEGNTVDKFGNPYEPSDELINNLYPIYIETIKELYQDQPYTVATFLTFYAFLGGGAQTYEPPKPKAKASGPVKPIAPIKPVKPVKPL